MKRYQVIVSKWSIDFPHYCVQYSTTYGLIWHTLTYSLWIRSASIEPRNDQPYLFPSKERASSFVENVNTIEKLRNHLKKQADIYHQNLNDYNNLRKPVKSIRVI